jgi:hypothetical protein
LFSQIQKTIAQPSFADFFTGRPIREEAIGNCLCSLFHERGYRIGARVNLWKVIIDLPPRSRKAISLLKQYRHPLQPDVDILVEDSSRSLWAHELKVIRWSGRGLKFVVPKARLYDGLGQALALATYGVNYVCLWHVFVVPMPAYRSLEARDPTRAEKIDDERIEFVAAYKGITEGILERFGLPIGYIAFGLLADTATGSAKVAPLLPWKEPVELGATRTGARIRPLLLKALGT